MFGMLAKAVEFIHGQTQPILHRDIKPVNIFLLKDGTLKLGDLGIGRVLNNSDEFAETPCGSPYYMSPAMMSDQPRYNDLSAIYKQYLTLLLLILPYG